MRFSKLLFVPIASMALLLPSAVAMAHQSHPAAGKPLVRVVKNSALGNILTNANGFTLYHLSTENTGKAVCVSAGCRSFWPPLLLPKGMKKPTGGKGLTGKLGVINRKGLGKQITYDGWALYTFKNDTKAGQTNGNGINAPFGDWRAVAATPMVQFTVDITTSPPTWGKVSLRYTYKGHTFKSSCAKSSCTFTNIHVGSQVHLTQTPTSAASWPFKSWQVQSVAPANNQPDNVVNTTSTGASIVVKSRTNCLITATYVVAGGY